MADKKKGGAKKGTDRHKPRLTVGIPLALADALKLLAERRLTNQTAEAVRAVRELLEREGLWPREGQSRE